MKKNSEKFDRKLIEISELFQEQQHEDRSQCRYHRLPQRRKIISDQFTEEN